MKTMENIMTNEQSRKPALMSASQYRWAALLVLLIIALDPLLGQGILRNGGFIRNTATVTYRRVINYDVTPGTIINSGTYNLTQAGGNGNWINSDGTLNGKLVNYIGGIGPGTVNCVGTTGNFTNSTGTVDNDSLNGYVGTIKLIGALTSSGTFDTDSGKVEYRGAAQTVLNAATTYGALVFAGSGNKTMPATTTVNDTLRVAGTATLLLGSNTLNLKGSIDTVVSGATFSVASGMVNYTGDRNQSVIPAQYKTLTLSSTGTYTKTAYGNVSFAASGVLTVSNDTLQLGSGTLNLNTNTPTFTNNTAVKVIGSATANLTGVAAPGSWYYASTSAQSIIAATYSSLRIGGGTGTKTFPSGTVAVTGNYSIDGGTATRDYTTNSNTFSFAGTGGTQTISGLSETFHILDFSGAALKSLTGTSLGAAKMTVSATSGIVTNDVTTLTLTNVASVSLTVASGATLVNNTGKTMTMSGDLENDGTVVNDGSLTTY